MSSTHTESTPFEIEVAMDEAVVLLEALTDAGQPVFLWGKPGIGKTDIVHQLAAKKGRKVIEFHAALREPVDLRGIPQVDAKTGTTKWCVPDELPRADRDGEYGFLFCDEYNQSTPQMQSALAGLVLYGVVGDYRLPKGWVVIAAGNRVSDRAAAQRMPTHIRSRFAHLNCVPTVDAWVKWANASGVPQEIVAFVRFRRDAVLHRMPRGDENTFPSPRTLVKCGPFVNVNPTATRQKLFAAHVGPDVAGELNGFIGMYHSLGSLEDIIRDPKGAKVPTEPSERYAVCTGLARMATRKNFDKVMVYANRLTGEPKMLLVHDATVRDPSLKETTAYSKWAVENSGMIMQSA